MTWKTSRTLIISIPDKNNQQNIVLSFLISPEKRKDFSKILLDFFLFCEKQKFIINIKDESIDLETNEPHSITFEILGDKESLIPEFQKVVNVLKHYSHIKNKSK